MAFELANDNPPHDAVVATTDCVDRMPRKIALTTACDMLGLTHWDFETFLGWVQETMVS